MQYVAPDATVRDAFHAGTCRRAYEMLGAHPVNQDGVDMWHFAVWAPNAQQVSLIGEFNEWKKDASPMVKQYDGIWELRVPAITFTTAADPEKYNYEKAAEKLTTYKFAVLGADGVWQEKADPYGFQMQYRPGTASRVYDLGGYKWHDAAWLRKRAKADLKHSPMNIYELHLGSWRRGEDGRMLSYLETADLLIPYVTEMGYTHVELLPVAEHALDMSWGYQVSGYYAATSRYGEPKELMAFIDRCHQANIGVILDWVPAHFLRDEFGLRRFDGSPCYEHADPRRGDMPQWGTSMFDYGRGEVSSFMLSNACFWIDWFHADGLRADAVSAMLYHDFCRGEGQWLPNIYGGHENLEAIAFLRRLNQTIRHDFPGVITVAEEATAWPKITGDPDDGGLGFSFKWNMGWMNDMLFYVKQDPIYRKYHHDKLTFSLMYAFSENYVLPFSHDEVVHGKKSMLNKNPGDIWKQFAGLRALIGYTMAHPGKKLLFMGYEFGQYIEWKFDDQLDWFLLLYEKHPDVQRWVKELNHFYLKHSEMYQVDDGWDGFRWTQADDNERSIVGFLRTNRAGKSVLCVTNFTPVYYESYRMPMPQPGKLTEILNSDLEIYGGSGQHNAKPIKVEKMPCGTENYSAEICVPPMSTVYYIYDKKPIAADTPAEEKPKRKRTVKAKAEETAVKAETPAEEKPKRKRTVKAKPEAEA